MKKSVKIFNNEFISNSNNKKPLRITEKSIKASEKFYVDLLVGVEKINTEKNTNKLAGVLCAFRIDNNIYSIIVEPQRIVDRFCQQGEQVQIASPISKTQLKALINTDYCEYVGTYEELATYEKNINYTDKNKGQLVQKFLAKKWHSTTNTTASLKNGGDAIIRGGRINEVKYFNFDVTGGTPKATYDKYKK